MIFIFKGFIYKIDNQNDNHKIRKNISHALFVLLVLVLIRQGNYMLNGLPLLFMLYYFNGAQFKNDLLNEISDD